MRVLLVKMSSMGDLVHTLPAITDAAAHGVRFDWVVEEAFVGIAEHHPAVDQVIPIAWRRWRGQLGRSRGELSAFFSQLRERRYDLVLDAPGLWKSAAVALAARASMKAGFDRASAREGASTLFYKHHAAVPVAQHAIDRQRQLFARHFDYPVPESAPTFGIETPAQNNDRSALLTHGTTWASKHWPESMWIALSRALHQRNYQVLLPAGNSEETERAQRIAAASDARVLPPMVLSQLYNRLANAALVVGVDSGLSHLAAALGRPTVTLYGATDPALTGARGQRAVNLAAEFACAPCRSRQCGYQGDAQLWQDEPITPACFSRITPEQVLRTIEAL